MVLLYIYLSPYHILIHSIFSTLLSFPWLFFFLSISYSYLYHRDWAAIYFLISSTLSVLSFLLCCLFIDSSFFFAYQMSYIIYLDGAAIYFLISRTKDMKLTYRKDPTKAKKFNLGIRPMYFPLRKRPDRNS